MITTLLIGNPQKWSKTCPACKTQLLTGRSTLGGHYVWCGNWSCNTMADGPNEGGHGKTTEKAFGVMLSKLGLADDYQIENDEIIVENPNTGSFEVVPKVKGKRGKKAKPMGEVVWPEGQFTMKEFCEKNETYPAKALVVFKKNKVKECGKREKPEGQRGKAATLYSVKN